jgi:hypothetical protein
VALVAGVLMSLLTIELMRRKSLREKYAVLWLLLSGFVLLLAVVPGLLLWFANLFGFTLAANFVFFLAIFGLFALAMQFSVEVGRVEHEVGTLAEELAFLRNEIEKLRARLDEKWGPK